MKDDTNLYYYIISNQEQWFNDISDKIGRLFKELELGYSFLYSRGVKVLRKILSFTFIIGLSIFAGIKFIINKNMTNIFMITGVLLSTGVISYLILLTLRSFGFLFPDTVFKLDRKQSKKQAFLTGLRTWLIQSLIGGAVLGALTTLIVSMIIR